MRAQRARGATGASETEHTNARNGAAGRRHSGGGPRRRDRRKGLPYDFFQPGTVDLEWRANNLAVRLSESLKPLARVAYNYRWSWMRDGEGVFRDINPHRWELSGANPVRFLNDLWPGTM